MRIKKALWVQGLMFLGENYYNMNIQQLSELIKPQAHINRKFFKIYQYRFNDIIDACAFDMAVLDKPFSQETIANTLTHFGLTTNRESINRRIASGSIPVIILEKKYTNPKAKCENEKFINGYEANETFYTNAKRNKAKTCLTFYEVRSENDLFTKLDDPELIFNCVFGYFQFLMMLRHAIREGYNTGHLVRLSTMLGSSAPSMRVSQALMDLSYITYEIHDGIPYLNVTEKNDLLYCQKDKLIHKGCLTKDQTYFDKADKKKQTYSTEGYKAQPMKLAWNWKSQQVI
ncbi:hypothetical protein [Fulvivirga sedimenti]|uniref:Uncharacterized protein n=1 Tax=Fulvivirga sedimenti TaxID=2879465 RepID=A0A9X1HVV4_9BACT|nr:hypothetical protein [Fulvivirga sedimenti]MCA6078816.1 hypothetical protein [Fulvivirga sedimenti]